MRLNFLKIPAKVSLLAFCLWAGYHYSNDIDKLELNILERRTNVEEGYYKNITNLEIFLDKEEGYFVPKYGTNDMRIKIGEDLAPKDMYGLLEKRIENGNIDTKKFLSYIDLFTSFTPAYADSIDEKNEIALIRKIDSLSSEMKKKNSIYFLSALNNYIEGDSSKRLDIINYLDQ